MFNNEVVHIEEPECQTWSENKAVVKLDVGVDDGGKKGVKKPKPS